MNHSVERNFCVLGSAIANFHSRQDKVFVLNHRSSTSTKRATRYLRNELPWSLVRLGADAGPSFSVDPDVQARQVVEGGEGVTASMEACNPDRTILGGDLEKHSPIRI
eukprot:760593-Hanusia_phi.AAC.18